jgi:tetratricopeptide (TPR) repeat protein
MGLKRLFAKSCFYCLPGLILFVAAGCAQACESLTGTISGKVHDPTGAAVEGVKVTLTDQSGSSFGLATTSSTGVYAFDKVKAGKYELKAERTGFHAAHLTDINLAAQQKVVANVILQPSQTPAEGIGQERSSRGQAVGTVGYYESSSLKTADFAGSVDPGGYSAPGTADTASRLLAGAVTLKQDSAARLVGNSANATEGSTRSLGPSEPALKDAVKRNPDSFEANHDLGNLYLGAGKPEMAIPYLEEANRLNSLHRANAYDLALAYARSGNLPAARQQIQAMIKRTDTAELHTLWAEVEEKAGNFADAAKEYERAAQIEPSEQNLFDWGYELLLHRAFEPAIDVFKPGVERYPKSPEMWIGLGIAFYLHGNHDDAVRSFGRATDLNPSDDRPYIFLADAYNASSQENLAVTERLKRFAELHPQNARAVYFYALSLWKGSRGETPQPGLEQVEALLRKSVALDPKFPDAYLQLGNLYASQQKHLEAIEQYQRAIELNPDLAEAYYRLGQALARTGRNEQAEQALKVYERLHQQRSTANQEGKTQQLIILLQDQGRDSAP